MGRFWPFSGVLGRGWRRSRSKIPDRGGKTALSGFIWGGRMRPILSPRCWIGLRIGAFLGFWCVLGRGWRRSRGKIPDRG